MRITHDKFKREHHQRVKKPRYNSPAHNHQFEEPILCTLFSVVHAQLLGNPEIDSILDCVTDDGIYVPVININEGYVDLTSFKSGETRISVSPSGISKDGVIDMNLGSGVIVSDNYRNNKQITNAISSTVDGNFILIVIRVIDNKGNSPDLTSTQLSEKIFGNRNNTLSLVRSILIYSPSSMHVFDF